MNSNMYFNPGGCETYEEWKDGYGLLAHSQFLKPAGDTSTAVTVATTYEDAPTNANLLLFAWHSTVTEISVRDNRVYSVQTEKA